MSATEEPVKLEAEVKPEAEIKTEETQSQETKAEAAATTESTEEPVNTETETAEKADDKADILKTTARIDNDYRKNKKFDPRQLPESNDPLEMLAQVSHSPLCRSSVLVSAH